MCQCIRCASNMHCMQKQSSSLPKTASVSSKDRKKNTNSHTTASYNYALK